MAQILEFKFPNGKKPHHRKGDAALTREKTYDELFIDAYEDVIGDWQRYAAKNQLSNYIGSKLPASAIGPLGSDYVNDLNVISTIEQKLKMKVSTFGPGVTQEKQIGWMAAFHLGEKTFSTPNDMVSEANARALLIVLYLHFTMILKSLGRDFT